MQKNRRSRILHIAGYVLMIISLVYIVRLFINIDIDWSRLPSTEILIGLMALFCIPSAAMLFLSAEAWRSLIRVFSGVKIKYRPTAIVFLRANIAKYLPGNVMHFAGRNLLGKEMGIGQIDMALSTVGEIGLNILAAVSLVVVLSFEYITQVVMLIWETPSFRTIFILVGLICLIAVIVVAIIIHKKQALRSKLRQVFQSKARGQLVKAVLIYLLSFIVYGLLFIWVVHFILNVPFTFSRIFPTIAASSLSWLAGYLVPGAPGGIGIRETVSILLLGNLYDAEIAALSSIIVRIIMTIADIVAFLLTFLLQKRSENDKDSFSASSVS